MAMNNCMHEWYDAFTITNFSTKNRSGLVILKQVFLLRLTRFLPSKQFDFIAIENELQLVF